MQGALAIKDTYLDGHNVTGNNGEEGVIYIGRSASIGAPLVGLIRFDAPPPSSQFAATLGLVPQYCSANGEEASVYLSLATYPLDWDEFAASWQSVGGLIVDDTVQSLGPVVFSRNLDVSQPFDVTDLVLAAMQQDRAYIDILIHPATESHGNCAFYSKDSGTHPERGPRLVVLNG